MLLEMLRRKEVRPSDPTQGQHDCPTRSQDDSGGSCTAPGPSGGHSSSLLGYLRSAVQQVHGNRGTLRKPQKSVLELDAKLSPFPVIPAKFDTSTGEVVCGQCSREIGKIVDYGLEDEHTFYFVVKCPKCGRKNKYLKGTGIDSIRMPWIPTVQNYTSKLGGIMLNHG